jgi:release factor glutamine methyltransferase
MSETWTIGRLLQWTTEYLQQHGAQSPRLDAEVLLAEARGCRRIDLYTCFDEPAAEATRVAFRELVRRRAEGMPVAYLVGKREFYSLSFRVTPDVLIPRPETELLVVRLLDLARQRDPQGGSLSIVDVGTGSGVIAICAARHLPQSRVTATDISLVALEVARGNAASHGVLERISWQVADLLEGVGGEEAFDLIVSNPPYVSEAEFATLSPTVRQYEPRQALVAGPTGTEVIARLMQQSARRLRPGGWLLCEISPMIEPAVASLLADVPALKPGPTIKDLAGHARVMQAQRRA